MFTIWAVLPSIRRHSTDLFESRNCAYLTPHNDSVNKSGAQQRRSSCHDNHCARRPTQMAGGHCFLTQSASGIRIPRRALGVLLILVGHLGGSRGKIRHIQKFRNSVPIRAVLTNATSLAIATSRYRLLDDTGQLRYIACECRTYWCHALWNEPPRRASEKAVCSTGIRGHEQSMSPFRFQSRSHTAKLTRMGCFTPLSPKR